MTYNYEYDPGDRIKEVKDPEEGISSYEYDTHGNIVKVMDPNEGVTSYKYDSMNRLIEETFPIGGLTHEYSYNSQGLLEEARNANGQKTTYCYDAVGRITSMKDELGEVSYTYDKVGNILTVKDKNGVITRTYDKLNRVSTYTDYNGNTVKYGYDEIGNRISLTYPGGEIVRYSFDNNGNIKTVTDPEGRVTGYDYDKNGRLIKTARPDGSTETRQYDAIGRLTEQKDTAADGTVLHHYIYEYDGRNNIVKKTGVNAPDTSLITDAVMTYDQDNRLITYNGQQVEYDKEGNMTYGPVNGEFAHFTYDCRNRLIRLETDSGEITEYEYDAENTRTALIKNGKKTVYIVDKEAAYPQALKAITYTKNLIGRYSSKETETVYTYGIGLISQNTDKGGSLYYHYNNVGSTTEITDATGDLMYSFAYGTYGELCAVTDAGGNSLVNAETKDPQKLLKALNEAVEKISVSYLYNGQYGAETDANGLYYMRARYYNTDIKRFINRDVVNGTIDNSQSLNKYCYVQGNPVTKTDPFGLCPDGNGGSDFSRIGHSILDVAGFLFDVADVINAVWYAFEGDWTNVALSVLSILPALGSIAAKGLKYGGKYIAKGTKLAAKYAAKGVKKLSAALIKAFGETATHSYALAAKAGTVTISAIGGAADDVAKVGKKAISKADDVAKKVAKGTGGNNPNGIYKKADYHGKKNNPVKNKAPNKGQEALDNSVAIGPNTTRRVGISDGEIVVFDETTSGVFHGHVRSWNELSDQMKAALRKAGMVNKKGKIIK